MQTDPPTPIPKTASSPPPKVYYFHQTTSEPLPVAIEPNVISAPASSHRGCGRCPAEITPNPQGEPGRDLAHEPQIQRFLRGCRGTRALLKLSAPPLGVRGSGGSIPAGAGVGEPTPQRQRGSEVTFWGTAAAAGSKGAAPERLRSGCPAPRGRHGSGPCSSPKSRPQPGSLRSPGADKTHRQSLAKNSIRGEKK